jgi:hypothetical protein
MGTGLGSDHVDNMNIFLDCIVAELSAAASEDFAREDSRAVQAVAHPVPCVQRTAAQEVR